ncbi:MAG: PIG-L family deacetylase [Candidatus Nanopelagicales bacterium]|nr:PIG-L family deacetylase [Candidatus Nanopelagicales bacterium]MDZ4248924.1 PIG-L family deacetylase [Candidatus Nanopelagicales bacterium]
MAKLIETPRRVDAVPELRVVRHRPRRVVRRLALVVAVMLVAGLVAGALARSMLNESETPEIASLVGSTAAPRLLAIFAEPGDELAAAGTLAQLDSSGVRTAAVYLTDGGAPAQGADSDEAQSRPAKLPPEVASAIGLDQVDSLGYEAATIADQDPAVIGKKVADIIAAFAPSTVLTLPAAVDANSREAHAVTGSIALNAVTQSGGGKAGPVTQIWTATLPEQRIGTWLPMPGAFSDYAAENENVLPEPTAAVSISGFAGQIHSAASVYDESMMDETQPWLGMLPAPVGPQVYYRVLDREYFSETFVGTPAG